jgi:hypothetical protein
MFSTRVESLNLHRLRGEALSAFSVLKSTGTDVRLAAGAEPLPNRNSRLLKSSHAGGYLCVQMLHSQALDVARALARGRRIDPPPPENRMLFFAREYLEMIAARRVPAG